jgi:hypothetical protein
MLIPEEGSALNDDYDLETGRYDNWDPPRDHMSNPLHEFDFSNPRDEYGPIHYDIHGNVINPPPPMVTAVVMPARINDDDDEDDDHDMIPKSILL